MAAVGGDHSVSFPVGRGVADVYGTVDVVHIDAHSDFADTIYGSKLSHGSQLRRLYELPTTDQLIALGLRSVDRDQYDDMRRLGVGFASTKALLDEGPERGRGAARPARARPLRLDRHRCAGRRHRARDHAAGAGRHRLPELRDLLVAIAGHGRVVGFDIVETSAAQMDVNTSMTTAWLMVHFLSAIYADRSTSP